MNDRTGVDALSFDLDATLLDGSRFREAVAATCSAIEKRTGLSAARLLSANDEALQAYWPTIEATWTLGAIDGASVTREIWRRTAHICAYDDEESFARFASQTLLQLGPQTYRLFADVPDLFTSLRHARTPLALITNGASDSQRDKLRVLGIEDWFGAVVVSGEVGIAKPDVEVFEMAVDRLAVPRNRVWHVGDNLETDVAGAKAAGMTAVWLNRKGHVRRITDPVPDVEIRSLSELRALL